MEGEGDEEKTLRLHAASSDEAGLELSVDGRSPAPVGIWFIHVYPLIIP